jgi:hypothetical protein
MPNKDLIPAIVFLSLMLNEIESQAALKQIRKQPQTQYIKKLIRELHAADEKIRKACFALLNGYENNFEMNHIEKSKLFN